MLLLNYTTKHTHIIFKLLSCYVIGCSAYLTITA